MSILDRAIALCESDNETYQVFLPTGDYVEFRHVVGPDEVSQLEVSGRQFVENVKKGMAHRDILALKVRDAVTLVQVHFVSKLYVASYRLVRDDDGLPILGEHDEKQYEKEGDDPNAAAWLNMAKRTPYAFKGVWAQIDEELTGRASMQRRELVEAAKKD